MKILGKNAVYYYAVYLVCSALVRDHFINESLKENAGTVRITL
jgi:methylene-fatty-acyl-phospholipid synthase